MIEVGDILAIQGTGWFSDAIRKATGGGPYSHVGIITATTPVVQVTEALERVRTRVLTDSIKDAAHAWILHPPHFTDTDRIKAVVTALSYSTDEYGWWDIAMQGMDSRLKTKWFTSHFAETKYPICSMLAALCDDEFDLDPKSVTPNDFYNLHWPTDQLK